MFRRMSGSSLHIAPRIPDESEAIEWLHVALDELENGIQIEFRRELHVLAANNS